MVQYVRVAQSRGVVSGGGGGGWREVSVGRTNEPAGTERSVRAASALPLPAAIGEPGRPSRTR